MAPRCPSRKRAFRSEQAAEDALAAIWAAPHPGGRRLETRYYQCEHCECYHLTSQRRK